MKKTVLNDNWKFSMEGKEARVIRLPHDAMLESKRDADAPSGGAGAFFHGGIYTYERELEAPKDWKDKTIILQFEGVYRDAEVYLNGEKVGGCAYGYLPFFVDLTHKIKAGAKNSIKVTADNSHQPDSRWYSGGGIYRNVNLWAGEENPILPEAVKVKILSLNPARIRVEIEGLSLTDSRNATGEGAEDNTEIEMPWIEKPRIEILGKGQLVAEAEGSSVEIEIPDAKLWSEEDPYLYDCRVTMGKETAECRFGIRTLNWDKTGFYVNGKRTLLRGGCLHHDNGILGAAAFEGAEYRRVKKLKEAGYNAIRSAHNPCSPAMLEACDELGVYVMEEAWDMWYNHKTKYDYAGQWKDHYLDDLRAIVERDYNHPSVIMYSIGNEVSEPGKQKGIDCTEEMTAYLHSLDDSRPVTGGFNLSIIASASKGKGIYDEEEGGMKNNNADALKGMNSTLFNMITSIVGTGMNKAANSRKADAATSRSLDLLDMAGYNYASGRYPLEGKAHPNRVVFGSETFPQDIAKNWEMVKKYPYLVGDFMWTAWDYLGEAGIGAWAYTPDGKGFNKPYPWLLADCGAFDILGHPGAPVALARAAWEQTKIPWIGVWPINHPRVKPIKSTWRGSNAMDSWSWAGCEGNKAVVEVYSSANSVELILNGKSIAKKKTKLCKAMFRTKYQKGELEAVAYDAGGKEVGRNKLTSASGSIRVNQSEEVCKDLRFVEISLADENGIVESNADRKLKVKVIDGELLAFGSANPRTEEDYLSGSFTTYYGRALAVVKGTDAKLEIKSIGNGTG